MGGADLVDGFLEQRFEAFLNNPAANASGWARGVCGTSVVFAPHGMGVLWVPLSEDIWGNVLVGIFHLLGNDSGWSAWHERVLDSHVSNNFISWSNWNVSSSFSVSVGFSCVDVSIEGKWLHPADAIKIVVSIWEN